MTATINDQKSEERERFKKAKIVKMYFISKVISTWKTIVFILIVKYCLNIAQISHVSVSPMAETLMLIWSSVRKLAFYVCYNLKKKN